MNKVIVFITKEIVPFHYGGIGTLFMSIGKFFHHLGHDVCFLTEKRDDFDKREYRKYYGDIPVYFLSDKGENEFIDYSPSGGIISTLSLAYSFKVAEAYEELVRKVKPDIVFSADYGAEAFVLLFKKALGNYSNTRFILHLSGALNEVLTVYQKGIENEGYNELDEPGNKLICSMEDTCMLLADEIVSPSDSAWQQLSLRLNLLESGVKFIPNLMDKKSYRELVDQETIKKFLHDKIILFVGRLDRHKGADVLLGLYLEYMAKHSDGSKLVFIGRDCFCREYGRTFLAEWEQKIPAEYRDQIEFLGQVDHERVEDYFKRASVCVFPSRWEVFGIVCLEAMAYGVPSLVTKQTGLAELLGEDLKENCFDFETEKDGLLNRLHYLLSTPDNNIELRKKLRKRALEIVEMGEQGYREILNEGIEPPDKDLPNGVLENMLDSLHVMSDISGFLGNDFMKLNDYYGVSDGEVKRIIQQGGKHIPDNMFQKLKSFIR